MYFLEILFKYHIETFYFNVLFKIFADGIQSKQDFKYMNLLLGKYIIWYVKPYIFVKMKKKKKKLEMPSAAVIDTFRIRFIKKIFAVIQLPFITITLTCFRKKLLWDN